MKIEEIQAGDYKARINVSLGGNCISLRNEKYRCHILREPDYEKGIDNPYLYGMPILFPVNRISSGSFEFEGRTYTFPVNETATNCSLHGTLHKTEFEVIEKKANSMILSYKATKQKPYHTFPHEFEVRLEYSLNEKGLMQKTEIYNFSDKNMPIFLGFHTTFDIPFMEETNPEQLSVYADIADEFERDMSTYLPTGNILSYDEVSQKIAEGTFVPDKNISRHYRSGETGIMSITDKETGISVIYESCVELAYRLIYCEGKGFICLEPQTCIANCQNASFSREEVGFTYIEPGEKKTYWSKIWLIFPDQK